MALTDRRTLYIQLIGSQLIVTAEALAREVKVRDDETREDVEGALQDLSEVHIALQGVITTLAQALNGNVADCLEYLKELVEYGIEHPLEKRLAEYDEDAPWCDPGKGERLGWTDTKGIY